MKRLLVVLCAMLFLSGMGGITHAELIDNADGTVTQIKDDGSALMWAKDANLAGGMVWSDAMAWVDQLEYCGHADWRLPTSPATTQGFNNEGEMGYLYYTELGNPAGGPLTNTGPFINMPPIEVFWLSAEPLHPGSAWNFEFYRGMQNASSSIYNSWYAWPVRDLVTERILFGWKYPGGGLVSIDTQTGATSLVIRSDRKVEGLAFDSVRGILHGVENLSGDNMLLEIDVERGEIREIGPVTGYTEITAMTFDETTGKIFALDQTSMTLLEIDPVTAVPIAIGYFARAAANGLAAHPTTGELFAGVYVDPSYLATVDKLTATSNLIGSTETNALRALAFNPVSGVLFGNAQLYGPPGNALVTIDLETGLVEPIGGPSGQITALAFAMWPSDTDTDGDGIPDDEDACPNSDLSETVVIDGCDSGVENHLLEGGCTISDRIEKCAAGVRNHGKFVSCVSKLTNKLKKAGLITGSEKGAIQSCAAQSDYGKKKKKEKKKKKKNK